MPEVIELPDTDDEADNIVIIQPDRPVSQQKQKQKQQQQQRSPPRPDNVGSSVTTATRAALPKNHNIAGTNTPRGGKSSEDPICLDDGDDVAAATAAAARTFFRDGAAAERQSARTTSNSSSSSSSSSSLQRDKRASMSVALKLSSSSFASSPRKNAPISILGATDGVAGSGRKGNVAAASSSSRRRRRRRRSSGGGSSYHDPLSLYDDDDDSNNSDSSELRRRRQQRQHPGRRTFTFRTSNKRSPPKMTKSSNGAETFDLLESSSSDDDNNDEVISILDDDDDDEVPQEAFSPSKNRSAAEAPSRTAAVPPPREQQKQGLGGGDDDAIVEVRRPLFPAATTVVQDDDDSSSGAITGKDAAKQSLAAAVSSNSSSRAAQPPGRHSENVENHHRPTTGKRKDPPGGDTATVSTLLTATATATAGSTTSTTSTISTAAAAATSSRTELSLKMAPAGPEKRIGASAACQAAISTAGSSSSTVGDEPPEDSLSETRKSQGFSTIEYEYSFTDHDDDDDDDDDDHTSSPDESMDLPQSNGEEEQQQHHQQQLSSDRVVSPISSFTSPRAVLDENGPFAPAPTPLLLGTPLLPEELVQELLRPPPLQRSLDDESFQPLLGPLHRKSEWVRSVQKSKGPNVELAMAWKEMGRKLREWQTTVDGVDVQEEEEEMIEVEAQKKAQNKVEVVPKEDRNFHGGVDPKVNLDAESQDQDLDCMHFVPMLDHPYIDQVTGLPGRKFTVFGFPDDVIYTFHLQVRTSSIPNAGHGVFLKFLGAQELKPSKKRREVEVHDLRQLHACILFEDLSALHPHGFGMKVTLTGEHLKARYNSLYPLPKLKAAVPDNRVHARKRTTRTKSVKFSDPDLPYDEDELQGLRNPGQRIGHFGLFTSEDYVDAPQRTFSSLHSNCGFIDIGRYGPFLKEDRKMELHNQAKGFFFGYEPLMWSFSVPEKILGRDQSIDITDDLTGEPHAVAQANIPMYVNEVGHNPALQATIHACDEEDRNIKYYLMIKNPMQKGDEIELFVDYKEKYEENRVRKGYGKENLTGRTRGDDHLPSRLQRNLIDRRDLLDDIEGTEIIDFYLLVEFCHEIAQKLHPLINDFINNTCSDECATSPLTARQINAIRRLDWIVLYLKDHSERLKEPATSGAEYSCADVILAQCNANISEICWGKWPDLFAILDECPTMTDTKGKKIRIELEKEAVEEICFKVSDRLVMPLDESRWCPVANELMYTLCNATARTLWQNLDRKDLAQTFIRSAAEAAKEIRNPADSGRLAFDPLFDDHFVSRVEADVKTKTKHRSKVVVTKAETQLLNRDAATSLMGQTTSIDVSGSKLEMIQTTWYLARQVMFVVDALSGVALGGEPTYSREQLLEKLGIDSKVCEAALNAEILPPKRRKAPSSKATPKARREGRVKADGSGLSKKQGGPPKEKVNNLLFWQIIWSTLKDLGWNLEHGNRPNDFYACPPGVARGKGFRSRVDFFDSVLLVLNCLKTYQQWKDEPTVKSCLQEYDTCKDIYEKLRASRKLPKFETKTEMSDWLRKQAKSRSG